MPSTPRWRTALPKSGPSRHHSRRSRRFSTAASCGRCINMAGEGRLAGRVALVSGGGGEIGGAIARLFAREGAEIAVADLEPGKAESVARSIEDAGGTAQGLGADVADEASAREAVARTVEAFGRLTTLVNVAATITPDGTVETLSL